MGGSHRRGSTIKLCVTHYFIRRSNADLASGVSRGGFLVARKPPPGHDFFLNQGGDILTGTDLHQPLKFATFENPH